MSYILNSLIDEQYPGSLRVCEVIDSAGPALFPVYEKANEKRKYVKFINKIITINKTLHRIPKIFKTIPRTCNEQFLYYLIIPCIM